MSGAMSDVMSDVMNTAMNGTRRIAQSAGTGKSRSSRRSNKGESWLKSNYG
jgi:hypothetical protein